MPKRYNHFYAKICDFGQLVRSAKRARQGTGWTVETQRFFYYLESELLVLQQQLTSQTYQPSPYRYFSILDPKPRVIAVAPFRDRVVHHALIEQLMPLFEPVFIHDSYATRVGKGTHAAIKRAQQYSRRWDYYLKIDIDHFFASVDQSILFSLLQRKIKDKAVLHCCEKIIANASNTGKGLPIGNLTSQFWANVYLNPLDHFIKEELKVKGYIRYMDDHLLFATSSGSLQTLYQEVQAYLDDRLRLWINRNATCINATKHGISYLGMRIFPNYIRTCSKNWQRSQKKYRRRLAEFHRQKISEQQLAQSLQGILAFHQRFTLL